MTTRLLAMTVAIGSAVVLAPAAQEPVGPAAGYPFRPAADNASVRIARLRAEVADLGPSAVAMFWNEVAERGAPIIEPIPGDAGHSRVTFVWQGSAEAQNVVVTDGVSVGVGGAEPLNSRMTHIEGTDVWYRSYEVRNDGRFTYALSENDPMALFTDPDRTSSSTSDPLNPNRLPIIGQTYVELPDAPTQPWIEPMSPEMSGEVVRRELAGRMLRVYLPVGFQRSGETYPLVLTMAGGFYADMAAVTPTLDHLIAEGRIRPVVAVAVSGRSADLQCSPDYARFLAKELVPWMRANFHVTDEPELTVIAGSSLGGLASTYAAVSHPDVFGKVLSQSGSYWWNRVFRSREEGDDFANAEWLTSYVRGADHGAVDFYMEVGLMEFEGQLDTNRRMRDALVEKGYDVHYREFNGNHSFVNWRGSFGQGLEQLLGGAS